ncbi:MAG: sigma-70 family RNA polymerase sigma factor [Bacteroidetes bacterium]|uniref:Sigma-70 family RNA polymerase sigma factor n=1 Tax=Candidatus Cryptobacteroides intestinigallinarum TaxID=2840767 RepID=A0A9D9HL42_9BACT|nr:sigma-70 family RNA polymerase sigma factor [Candidatus Cryptobacteroides intestinigallinarum]
MEKDEFKKVWLPLSDSFYKAAFHMLKSESDAQDAVQDLFIRLWNSRSTLDKVNSPSAYGMAMLRNICIDRLRRSQADQAKGMVRADTAADVASDETAEEAMVSREKLQALEAGIAKLPQTQREVFIMRFYRQMSYDEISAETGLSYINVRVMINRARNFLKKAMAF